MTENERTVQGKNLLFFLSRSLLASKEKQEKIKMKQALRMTLIFTLVLVLIFILKNNDRRK